MLKAGYATVSEEEHPGAVLEFRRNTCARDECGRRVRRKVPLPRIFVASWLSTSANRLASVEEIVARAGRRRGDERGMGRGTQRAVAVADSFAVRARAAVGGRELDAVAVRGQPRGCGLFQLKKKYPYIPCAVWKTWRNCRGASHVGEEEVERRRR